jgi:hypothetical protein
MRAFPRYRSERSAFGSCKEIIDVVAIATGGTARLGVQVLFA